MNVSNSYYICMFSYFVFLPTEIIKIEIEKKSLWIKCEFMNYLHMLPSLNVFSAFTSIVLYVV